MMSELSFLGELLLYYLMVDHKIHYNLFVWGMTGFGCWIVFCICILAFSVCVRETPSVCEGEGGVSAVTVLSVHARCVRLSLEVWASRALHGINGSSTSALSCAGPRADCPPSHREHEHGTEQVALCHGWVLALALRLMLLMMLFVRARARALVSLSQSENIFAAYLWNCHFNKLASFIIA